MSDETADISEFADFYRYDWVMYRDTSVSYPGRNPKLGRYCGPAYDIGPSMCAKILKVSGEYAYRSSLRGLTAQDLADPVQIQLRKEFDRRISIKLGPMYVKSLQIDDAPEFKWWVNFTLKKREIIISTVNKCHHKQTQKFGIRIPQNAQEAHIIDK